MKSGICIHAEYAENIANDSPIFAEHMNTFVLIFLTVLLIKQRTQFLNIKRTTQLQVPSHKNIDQELEIPPEKSESESESESDSDVDSDVDSD